MRDKAANSVTDDICFSTQTVYNNHTFLFLEWEDIKNYCTMDANAGLNRLEKISLRFMAALPILLSISFPLEIPNPIKHD